MIYVNVVTACADTPVNRSQLLCLQDSANGQLWGIAPSDMTPVACVLLAAIEAASYDGSGVEKAVLSALEIHRKAQYGERFDVFAKFDPGPSRDTVKILIAKGFELIARGTVKLTLSEPREPQISRQTLGHKVSAAFRKLSHRARLLPTAKMTRSHGDAGPTATPWLSTQHAIDVVGNRVQHHQRRAEAIFEQWLVNRRNLARQGPVRIEFFGEVPLELLFLAEIHDGIELREADGRLCLGAILRYENIKLVEWWLPVTVVETLVEATHRGDEGSIPQVAGHVIVTRNTARAA